MLTIHVVPNAHLDLAWLWDWREGMNESLATCRAVADLMEKFPGLTFTQGDALVYSHIEKHDPLLFKRIKALFEDGRWEISSASLVQADTNLGCGEAYIRQYLYGREYFISRFGAHPETAYQVDSFGHAAVLPSIYSACGCRFAVQCRPSQSEMPLPSRLFRWRGPDGAEILTANLESYSLEYEDTDPGFTAGALIKKAAEKAPEGLDDWLLLTGLGNHGGGLSEKLLEEFNEYFSSPPEGCRLEFSTLGRFFSSVEGQTRKLPVVTGELQYSFRGCYTSVFPVKKSIKEAEALASRAERMASCAGMAGGEEVDSAEMKTVWTDIAFNHFHDILPGSSIERVCREAVEHLGRAKHVSREIENSAALSIFRKIDTSPHDGTPVLVFNPHAKPWKGFAETEWLLDYRPISAGGAKSKVKGAAAVSNSGREQYVQLLPTEMKAGLEWRVRGVFRVDVPAGGYRVYWLKHLLKSNSGRGKASVRFKKNGAAVIENGMLRVTCREGGTGMEVSGVPGRKWFNGESSFQVLNDPGDSWGGGITSWTDIIGNFKIHRILKAAEGPLKAAVRLESFFGNSRLVQEIYLMDGEEIVRCRARLSWNERSALCKMAFPFSTGADKLLCGGPYSETEREPGAGEGPFRGWAACLDKNGRGFGAASSGGSGCDWHSGSLRISIVRSVLYGSMLPSSPGISIEDYMDIGTHEFEYILAPAEMLREESRRLELPLHLTLGYRHRGETRHSASILDIPGSGAVLESLKKAEDGRGWIGRVRNERAKNRKAPVLIMGREAGTLDLPGRGISTFRVLCENNTFSLIPEGMLEGLEKKSSSRRGRGKRADVQLNRKHSK